MIRSFASKSSRVGRRRFSTLVLADSDKGGVAPATYNVISAAKQWDKDIVFLTNSPEAAAQTSKIGKTFVAKDVKTADSMAKTIVDLQKEHNFSHIVAPTASTGRDVLPRVGALLDVQPISDVMEVLDSKTFKRPMYAGNAIATVKSNDDCVICTVRPTSFPAAEEGAESNEVIEVTPAPGTMKFVSESEKADDKPQLGSAPIVVSGGRALGSAKAFDEVLQPLCDKLQAAMGASRAAVDAGYVANELQVGQTGKVVAPDLYIGVGLSGAIQHLAGMKDSKTIVCINKDPDAPIFSVADYGLVGDLFTEVPELTKKL